MTTGDYLLTREITTAISVLPWLVVKGVDVNKLLDLHPDDPKKAEEFRRVQEAYENILSGSASQSGFSSDSRRVWNEYVWKVSE